MSWNSTPPTLGSITQNGFLAIQQSNASTDENIERSFVIEVWDENRNKRATKDTDNPLPPTRGATAYKVSTSVIPDTDLQVLAYYQEDGSSQRESEQWYEVIRPSGGWNKQMIVFEWILS